MLLLGMYPYVGRNTINAVALNELSKCFLFFLLLFLHYLYLHGLREDHEFEIRETLVQNPSFSTYFFELSPNHY